MRASATRIFVAALAFAFLFPPTARAHPGHEVSFDQLSREADAVLEGQVSSVDAAWSADRRQIYTTVRVRVTSVHKGEAPGEFEFKMLGGTVGDITFAVLGQPRFEPEENVFLFLSSQWPAGVTPVLSGEHGKFSVRTDPVSGREYIVNDGATLLKARAVDTVKRFSPKTEDR